MTRINMVVYGSLGDALFLAEDLQHDSLSGSVTDKGGNQQTCPYDDGQRLPKPAEEEAPYDKYDAHDNPDDSLAFGDIFSDCHFALPKCLFIILGQDLQDNQDWVFFPLPLQDVGPSGPEAGRGERNK